jgi:hypothetical protein
MHTCTLFPTGPCPIACQISIDWIYVTLNQICVADRIDYVRKFNELDSIVPLTYFCITIDYWQNGASISRVIFF